MKRYCGNCRKISESDIEIKFCAHCGAEFEPIGGQAQEPPGGGIPPVTPTAQQTAEGGEEKKYCAWEDKANLGFFGALFETWKESLFNPVQFFRRMPVSGGIGNPLIYGIILGMIGVIFSMMYQQFWGNLLDPARFYPHMGRGFDWDMYDFTRQIESIWMLVALIISPVLITVAFFIASGIFHLILLIFGWNKKDFEATFRVVAYSEGAYFFEIIPFIGGMVSIIWATVLYIIGLKEIHKLSVGQAILVVLLPLVLFCFCCCAFVTWIIGMVGIAD
jgi:hypothetical protein